MGASKALLENGLTAVLNERYDLPPVQQVQPITAGFLSRNWTLQTSTNRYFLKQYRFTSEARIQGIHASKFHFAEAGLPVILPIVDRNSQSFFQYNHKQFALFPFVSGFSPRRGRLTRSELSSIASQLAQLHRAGQSKIVPTLPTTSQEWHRPGFLADVEKILAIIQQKSTKTPFDRLAEQKIRLKRMLADKISYPYTDLGLAHDDLIHGDYHPDNLFVDDVGQVKAIFDWEKSRYSHRLLELVRSVEFSCFSPGHRYGFVADEVNFVAGGQYLRVYFQIYPFTVEQLRAAFLTHFAKRIFSLWVEREHYLQNNERVDLFLLAGWEFLSYFAENFETFVARMIRETFA